MSKINIIQNGVIKSVPEKHAKILVAIKKATYADAATEATYPADTAAEELLQDARPKRAYMRKDLKAEA